MNQTNDKGFALFRQLAFVDKGLGVFPEVPLPPQSLSKASYWRIGRVRQAVKATNVNI